MYICIYIYTHIYVYIYREREKERDLVDGVVVDGVVVDSLEEVALGDRALDRPVRLVAQVHHLQHLILSIAVTNYFIALHIMLLFYFTVFVVLFYFTVFIFHSTIQYNYIVLL